MKVIKAQVVDKLIFLCSFLWWRRLARQIFFSVMSIIERILCKIVFYSVTNLNKGRTFNCRSFIFLSYRQIWIKSTTDFQLNFLFLHNMVPPIWNWGKISALTLFHRARTYAIWNSLALWPDTSISGSRPSTFPASSFRPKKTSRFTNCFRHFKNTNAPRALASGETHATVHRNFIESIKFLTVVALTFQVPASNHSMFWCRSCDEMMSSMMANEYMT